MVSALHKMVLETYRKSVPGDSAISDVLLDIGLCALLKIFAILRVSEVSLDWTMRN